VKGLYQNGRLWWVRLRIPKDVRHFYSTDFKKASLQTADRNVATERAFPFLHSWLNEFESIKTTPPVGKDLAEVADASEFLQDAIDERMKAEASKQAKKLAIGQGAVQLASVAHAIYEDLSVEEVLNVTEKTLALKQRALNPKFCRLSDARTLYLEVHPNGSKDTIIEASDYAIKNLVETVGDCYLVDLTRNELRRWITRACSRHKTTTVNRQLNQLKAIFRTIEAELGMDLRSLYAKLSVPNLAKDATDRYTPSMEDLKLILKTFADDPTITFIVYFGGRISELSGLMKADVHLDEPVPYITIKENAIRSLKTPSSEREFPLVGGALMAMTNLHAASLENPSQGLLPRYYKPRGGDSLSANINKKLKRFNPKLTTHCFRHGMKDLLLRVANVPEYLCNEIQGHGAATVARSYGAGAALAKKAEALERAYEVLAPV
jgi:integrase